MKITVTEDIFCQAFKEHRPDNFSYEGLCAIFQYLEELGYEHEELDVIAICCEFCEDELEEIKGNYDGIETMEDLNDQTVVIELSDTRCVYISY